MIAVLTLTIACSAREAGGSDPLLAIGTPGDTGETGDSAEADTGSDTGDTGHSPAPSAIDVTVTVADSGQLPVDTAVSFNLWVDPAGDGGPVQMGTVELGETAHLVVEPGTWHLSATFAWEDPSEEDGSGGYAFTECLGSDRVSVAEAEVVAVTLLADCSDTYLD